MCSVIDSIYIYGHKCIATVYPILRAQPHWLFTLTHLHKFETHDNFFIKTLLVIRFSPITLISICGKTRIPSHSVVR